jgi:DNA-binding NarL/FixJ family response regulator
MGKRQKQYPKGGLVRMTNDEHMRLTELAKTAGLSFSRFLVESGLTAEAPTSEDRRRRERAILELSRVGNNLNQIARQLNAQRWAISSSHIEETLKEVKAALKGIEELWQRR